MQKVQYMVMHAGNVLMLNTMKYKVKYLCHLFFIIYHIRSGAPGAILSTISVFAEGQDAFLWVTVSLSFAKERVRLNARPFAFSLPKFWLSFF